MGLGSTKIKCCYFFRLHDSQVLPSLPSPACNNILNIVQRKARPPTFQLRLKPLPKRKQKKSSGVVRTVDESVLRALARRLATDFRLNGVPVRLEVVS